MGRPEGIPKVIFLTLKFFHWSQIWKHQQTSLAPKVQWHEEDELKPTMGLSKMVVPDKRSQITGLARFKNDSMVVLKRMQNAKNYQIRKRRTFWCNKMQFFENLPVWFWKWFYLVKRLCLFFFYRFQLFVYNPQLLVFVPHIDIISTLCILQVVVCGLPQCR